MMKRYKGQMSSILSSVAGRKLKGEERAEKSLLLASLIMKEALSLQTKKEKVFLKHINKSALNTNQRAFIINLIDIAFRTRNKKKLAKKIYELILQYQIPRNLYLSQRIKFFIFRFLGKNLKTLLAPMLKKLIKKFFEYSILFDEGDKLKNFLKENSDTLDIGAIKDEALGENDANMFRDYYIKLAKDPSIERISIKISTICSKRSYELRRKQSLENIKKILENAKATKKKVSFHMESSKQLPLSIDIFKALLKDPSLLKLELGITLQSYLPQSFTLLKEIVECAKIRVRDGGSPIRIYLVKGAYLSLEKVTASKNNWPQAPFLTKEKTDANFKKMLLFASEIENVKYARLVIATHNVFDIAFALIVREENGASEYMEFQFFDKRTKYIRDAVAKVAKNSIVTYKAIIRTEDINSIVNYLFRRIDEFAGSQNFLHHIYKLSPNDPIWDLLKDNFLKSISIIDKIKEVPRNIKHRKLSLSHGIYEHFDNEEKTDFSHPSALSWQKKIISMSKNSPSNFKHNTKEEIDEMIDISSAFQKSWKDVPIERRIEFIKNASKIFRERRDLLIFSVMQDTNKTIKESDGEVTNAIDLMDYYCMRFLKLLKMKDLLFIPKGLVYIIASRAFPCSAPVGRIAASLLTGNTAIFKPALECISTAKLITEIFYEASIPKESLKLIICDDMLSKTLTKNKKISLSLLVGKSDTVYEFIKDNPIDLSASCEGSNAMIISSFADKDLAIKNLVESAFSSGGQRYCSCSLAILEKDVYDDPNFKERLIDATLNLSVGSNFDLKTDIGPHIREATDEEMEELTTLKEGERWLLKPKDMNNRLLLFPSIKLLKKDNLFKKRFLPIPLLYLVRAKNLSHAIAIANSSPYGLSVGLQSLDEGEHIKCQKIEVGNININRAMTDLSIRRQAPGGCKRSVYGLGFKGGGPNFLLHCLDIEQGSLPKEKKPVADKVNALTDLLEDIELTAEELGLWYVSIANYAYWQKILKDLRDPSKIVGEDNFLTYLPYGSMTLRIEKKCHPLDVLRILAAAVTVNLNLEVSLFEDPRWKKLKYLFQIKEEDEKDFLKRIEEGKIKRIRMASKASDLIKKTAHSAFLFVNDRKVLANGRYELLNYLREVAISYDYHRNGMLGVREGELRKPIL